MVWVLGEGARRNSNSLIRMLEKMLKSGFDKNIAIELINSNLLLKSREEAFATLDATILDLNNGKVEFIKVGACPTYVKKQGKVDIINSITLPVGILNDVDIDIYGKDLYDGDILVMCTDGVIDSNTEYQNKELWMKNMLENLRTDNVQKIADLIITESIDNGYGIAKDDMTVIVIKLDKMWKKGLSLFFIVW